MTDVRVPNQLKRHWPVLIVLLLHLLLALRYTTAIPLGEAPDESAHLSYAQFIAKNGQLPTTLIQRQEAGYRSTWPPLYHLVVSAPLAVVGKAPPTRLKAVGQTPRRLIPTNGQTIAAFVHTADEAWPWRGIVLAWHLGRLISVMLTALAVAVTYLLAHRLTGHGRLAMAAAALHGFLPQALFVGAVISDDTLLILLSGLTLLTLFYEADFPGPKRLLLLGLLLGLASVAKYNALPLWVITAVWLGWQARGSLHILGRAAVAIGAGAALTGGWWFGFVWRHFNQVDSQGWLAGSLAALSAGTSDASLRTLSNGSLISLPNPAGWGSWVATLFETFWGSFGGGSTIDFPGWLYGLLAVATLGSVIGLLRRPPPTAALKFFFLTPLFFLPLPLLRFILSGGNIVETAQGRHLFPALPAIALGLVWGLGCLPPRPPGRRSQFWRLLPFSLPALAFALSLFGINLIRSSYPPPIPLRTAPPIDPLANRVDIALTDSITLHSFTIDPTPAGHLSLHLLWQATAIPPRDYLVEIRVITPDGTPVGGWLGQPIGGRYPTRAWDSDDFLRETISVPLLPRSNQQSATVSLQLRHSDVQRQPASELLTLATLTLAPQPDILRQPGQLRADGLPADAPFTYRSTLSFVLPDAAAPPTLHAPTGQIFDPDFFAEGGVAHFIVAANWPSGPYRLETGSGQLVTPVINRPRQFEPPPMAHRLEANFAGAVTLLGYDLPRRRVAPGDSFPVTLHVQARRTMGRHLAIFNHLLDREAVQRGGVDRIPQNFYTTLLWAPGEIVSDAYAVPVEADAPPGVYWLDVGFYPADEPSRSLPLVVEGRPIDRTGVAIGPIKVGGPPPGVTIAAAAPQTPLDVLFGGQFVLHGYDVEPAEHPARLTLYWQAVAVPQADYTVFVHLLDADGQLVAQADGPPAGGRYPSSLWEPGEIIVDERPLPEPGPWQSVRVGLYRPNTGQRLLIDTTSADSLPLPGVLGQ